MCIQKQKYLKKIEFIDEKLIEISQEVIEFIDGKLKHF